MFAIRSIINFLLVAFLLLTLSCGKEDKEVVKPVENKFSYKGQEYKINDAVFRYFGETNFTNDEENINTHYWHWIILSDGKINGINLTASNATYLLVMGVATVMKDHTEEFKGGTFNSVSAEDFHGRKSPSDQNFFTTCLIRIDTNNDSIFSPEDIFIDASNGQITIVGEKNNFELNLNLKTTDTPTIESVKGTYDGVFEVIEK